MTDQQAIDLIEKELKEKTLGVTEQFLHIHSPVYDGHQLKVERIDRERKDNIITAYLPVSGEGFYFAVFVDSCAMEVVGFETEPCHNVYFRATSTSLTADELKAMTALAPTSCWNKGDPRRTESANYTFSNFEILPNPEPDEFEDKLKKLLDFLERDKEGIKRLVENANGYIQVAMYIHNANGMPGGPTIDKEAIRRMNDLGLSINFDMYIGGNSFKD